MSVRCQLSWVSTDTMIGTWIHESSSLSDTRGAEMIFEFIGPFSDIPITADMSIADLTTLSSFSEKAMAPTPVLLPGKSHGRRSLVGCSPWGREELGTERLHVHFSLSCIGEGNGNPLQCSCLENPRDGGA